MLNKANFDYVEKTDFMFTSSLGVIADDHGFTTLGSGQQPAIYALATFHAKQTRGFADGVETAIDVKCSGLHAGHGIGYNGVG